MRSSPRRKSAEHQCQHMFANNRRCKRNATESLGCRKYCWQHAAEYIKGVSCRDDIVEQAPFRNIIRNAPRVEQAPFRNIVEHSIRSAPRVESVDHATLRAHKLEIDKLRANENQYKLEIAKLNSIIDQYKVGKHYTEKDFNDLVSKLSECQQRLGKRSEAEKDIAKFLVQQQNLDEQLRKNIKTIDDVVLRAQAEVDAFNSNQCVIS
jgi:hypothetical protein